MQYCCKRILLFFKSNTTVYGHFFKNPGPGAKIWVVPVVDPGFSRGKGITTQSR